MRNKRTPFISDSYLSDNNTRLMNDNSNSKNNSYRQRSKANYSVNSATVFAQETPTEQPSTPIEVPQPEPEQEVPEGDTPALPAEPGTTPQPEEEVGYISVGVFTASGALPVEDAVVIVYTTDVYGDEVVLAHLVTDANGQVPIIEVPVVYDRANILESSEYFFSTYNLRVMAINYYTVNILDIRVFPNTTTNYTIDMIPVPAGTTTDPERTFVIPPSPIDISND